MDEKLTIREGGRLRSVYTVSQINRYIRSMFTEDYLLHSVMVRGEVSGCKYHSSGHIYFTLKDASGTLSCILFAGRRKGLSFRMKDGDQVIVSGAVDVYERDGRYQLYADRVIPEGTGLLHERYEELKRRLEEAGMFDESYKQRIPPYIRTLGVVTAPTGAAVRDIINIAQRRNPYVQIILYPAIVQGDAAPDSIVRGIAALERLQVDVMIVGRGGGSIEDLWTFNEEKVAEAVFNCTVPVISAVGHETDTVITDYVADLRAPTPSAAAELAVYDYAQYMQDLQHSIEMLRTSALHHAAMARRLTESFGREIRSRSPQNRVRTQRMELARLSENLKTRIDAVLRDRDHRLELYAGELWRLSPLQRLAGGYGYIADEEGRPIRSVSQAAVGDLIRITLKDGEIGSRAETISLKGEEELKR